MCINQIKKQQNQIKLGFMFLDCERKETFYILNISKTCFKIHFQMQGENLTS